MLILRGNLNEITSVHTCTIAYVLDRLHGQMNNCVGRDIQNLVWDQVKDPVWDRTDNIFILCVLENRRNFNKWSLRQFVHNHTNR